MDWINKERYREAELYIKKKKFCMIMNKCTGERME